MANDIMLELIDLVEEDFTYDDHESANRNYHNGFDHVLNYYNTMVKFSPENIDNIIRGMQSAIDTIKKMRGYH